MQESNEPTSSTKQTDQESIVMSPKTHFIQSPIVWGAVASGLFYVGLPQTGFWNASLQNTFGGHPLAYAATCLFWVGVAALVIKLWKIPSERAALQAELPDVEPHDRALDATTRLEQAMSTMAPKIKQSYAMRRLAGMCDFVRGRKSVTGLDSHLEYLGEFSGEQVHNSYGLVRTITWAVPILGFLGTVVGIAQAIENLDPAKLETSFGLVSQGLGVAFGTTALALGLSLVMVFLAYAVEKQERSLIADVEMKAIGWLTRLFPTPEKNESPLAAAESEAARKLTVDTESLIQRQTELWEHSIDTLRTQWAATCEQQQVALGASLSSGVESSLSSHRDLLSSLTSGWDSKIVDFSKALSAQADAQQRSLVEWQKLSGDQTQLMAIEKQLAESLESAHAAAALNETLHSLNAAVHLLTQRVRPNAA
jgi:biopolymer transport protein ExbB/TolQ